MNAEKTVFVVDDDSAARESVCALVQSMGVRADSFSSAEAYLAAFDETRPGCLISDLRMLGMSGTDLLEILASAGHKLPVILISGYVTVPVAVQAMKIGAVNVLRKPYEQSELWDAISTALAQDEVIRVDCAHHKVVAERFAMLTAAETQVLDLVCQGKANKVAARRLGISVRTVEDRRRKVYAKLQVDSIAGLVKLVNDHEHNAPSTRRAGAAVATSRY